MSLPNNSGASIPISLPHPLPKAAPDAAPQQVADADAMKASFERTLAIMQAAGPGTQAYIERMGPLQDKHQRIYDLTGEVYTQGNWVKVR